MQVSQYGIPTNSRVVLNVLRMSPNAQSASAPVSVIEPGHEPDPASGEAEQQATVRLAQVLGADPPTRFDPTEDYHEASRLYPGIVDPMVVGARMPRVYGA